MELYIRIKDGQAIDHPILGDNFREAFPHIDTNNLPTEFARFERVAAPNPVYGFYEGVTYEREGDVFKDVHHVRPMTTEEKTAKQDQTKTMWAEHGFKSWLFDESTCSFIAPTPYPQDGKTYKWDEAATSWVDLPESIKA